MFALISSLVVGLMILILLAPEATQDLMAWRVPRQFRNDPQGIGMRAVPTAGILIFGFAFFHGWDQLLHISTPHLSDPFQARLALAGGLLFVALGLWGCLWPVQFIERTVPALRGRISALSQASLAKVMLVGIRIWNNSPARLGEPLATLWRMTYDVTRDR
jgi:hypothetical protein